MTLSRAEVSTENAVSYLRQLSRHWAHKFPVELDEAGSHSRILLPKAATTLMSSPTHLSVVLETHDPADQDRMEQVVEEHLQRFGFRETLTFRWLRA